MFYLPRVRSREELLEKVGEEEVYKAVCKRVCQGGQAVVSMARLIQVVMLLEGIGERSSTSVRTHKVKQLPSQRGSSLSQHKSCRL